MQQQTSAEPSTRDIVLRRPPQQSVWTVTSSASSTISGSTTLESDGSFFFSLGSVSVGGTYATLFDAYRIVSVTAKFIPITNDLTSGVIYTVLDYDDINAVPLAKLIQYDTLKVCPSGTYFERTIKPRPAIAAFSSVFTSFAQADPNMWMNCASPNIQYYGIKYVIPAALGATVAPSWTVLFTYVIQFKNPT